MIADAIKDCSKRGGLILDPFGGSDTTLLVAERTGRAERLKRQEFWIETVNNLDRLRTVSRYRPDWAYQSLRTFFSAAFLSISPCRLGSDPPLRDLSKSL
jgi:DNA methylase